MINEMIGERILLDAEWLEENDPELFEWITSSKYWGRGYEVNIETKDAVVEMNFEACGIACKATFKDHPDGVKQSLDNQPVWGDGKWEDWSTEDIEKYYKMLK